MLKDLLGGEFVGKHNQATSDMFHGSLAFLGSVRDPWEWYISLWAYGCDNIGNVYRNVTRSPQFRLSGFPWRRHPFAAYRACLANTRRKPNQWKSTYRDVNDAAAFRDWLYMMYDEQHRYDFGEGFGMSPISKYAGLLTFRYIKLFCCKEGELAQLYRLSNYDKLFAFANEKCFVDHFIHNENLEEDLIKALRCSGVGVSDEQADTIRSAGRTNTSSRSKNCRYYYDEKTEQLIYERERLLVEGFQYALPSKRASDSTPRSTI